MERWRLYLPQFFIALVLMIAIFLRVYKIGDNFFFYNDQGTDAIRISRLLIERKVILVGTETSIGPQVRIGPFFYYLLAPFYIWQGSPIPPILFLIALSVLSVYLIYRFAHGVFDSRTALIALILSSGSYYLVLFARWLSNPNPIILLSILFLFSMKNIMGGKKPFWWVFSALLVGISFQLETASAFFYVFVFAFFTIWYRKSGLNFKVIALMILVFALTFVPQIIFDFTNNHIISLGIYKYLFQDKAFDLIGAEPYGNRLTFFHRVFRNLFFPTEVKVSFLFSISLFALTFLNIKTFWQNKYWRLLFLFVTVLVVGVYIYRHFVISYYFSGFFVPVILLVSYTLASATYTKLGKIFVFLFLACFIALNTFHLFSYLTKDTEAKEFVNFKNQKQAVVWIAEKSERHDVDLRVFIPDKVTDGIDGSGGYKYLLLIYGDRRASFYEECLPGQGRRTDDLSLDQSNIFFVLKEYDIYTERFRNWEICENIDRSELVESAQFGGITVEKRKKVFDE